MPKIIVRDNVQLVLKTAIDAEQTSVTFLAAAPPFNDPPLPGAGEAVELILADSLANPSQIEKLTATAIVDDAGDWQCTVTRGTPAHAFEAGATALLAPTAALIDQLTMVTPDRIHAINSPAPDRVLKLNASLDFVWVELETVEALTIESISPNTGDEAGGTAVTLTGTGFANFDPTAGDTWTIGGNPVTNITVVSSTEMTGETPAGTGSADVVVVIGAESETLLEGFTYEAAVGYAATVMADSPSAYYRLEETSGAIASDETEVNDGTYWGGPAFEQPGLISEGNSIAFDGADDALTSYVLGTVSAATFECWLSAAVGVGSGVLNTHVMGHRNAASGAQQLLLGLRSDGRLELRHRNDTGIPAEVTGTAVVDDGEPHYIVLVVDGSSNELRLYVDSTLDITSPFTSPSGEFPLTNAPMTFAAEYQHGDSAPKNNLQCVLDEVAIYDDKVLTEQQIADHYDAGSV